MTDAMVFACLVMPQLLLAIVLIIRAANKYYVSKSHLAAFRRRSEQVLASQKAELEATIQTLNNKISETDDRMNTILMSLNIR